MPSAPTRAPTRLNHQPSAVSFNAKSIRHATSEDKENIGSVASGRASMTRSQPLPPTRSELVNHQLPPFTNKRKSPRTPANKLSTADLIRNTEDAYNYEGRRETPEEHVTWMQGTIPGSSGPSGTMTSTKSTRSTRKGKKRARSSSPSVYAHKSPKVQEQDTIDLTGLRSSLQSPDQPASQHDDPGQDLYKDYMGISFGLMGQEAQPRSALPDSFRLSPGTPSKAPGSISKMQRSTSCGIVWPSSRQKKRRLNPVSAETSKLRERFAESRPVIMDRDEPKASRVGALMDTLQENALKIPAEPACPSSSSPHPDRVGFPTSQADSPDTPTRPLPQLPQNPQTEISSKNTSFNVENEEDLELRPEPVEEGHTGQQQGEDPESRNLYSDSFGEDDVLLEALDNAAKEAEKEREDNAASQQIAVDQSVHEQPVPEQARPGGAAESAPGELACSTPNRPPSAAHEVGANIEVTETAPGPAPADEEDEFGDEFDCDAEMAEIAAQYDTQEVDQVPACPAPQPTYLVPAPGPVFFVQDDGEDDGFGTVLFGGYNLNSYGAYPPRYAASVARPQLPPALPPPQPTTKSTTAQIDIVPAQYDADDDDFGLDDDDEIFQQIADGTLVLDGDGTTAATNQVCALS